MLLHFWVFYFGFKLKPGKGLPPHSTICHVGDHYASKYIIVVVFLFHRDVISNLVVVSLILVGHDCLLCPLSLQNISVPSIF